MLVIEVDVFDTEPLEGLVALLFDVFRVAARTGHGEPEFRCNEDLAALLRVKLEPGPLSATIGEKTANAYHFPMRSSESPYTFAVSQNVQPAA